MKILKKDLRHGAVTVKPENLDDLWLLEKIIKPHDVIYGSTERAIKIERGETKEKKRKMILVRLRAEKIEFNENQLRVAGKILESNEPNVGKDYHAFEILINEPVTIIKEWHKFELERLEKARIRHPHILICVLDEKEAAFAMLTERLTFLGNIEGPSGKSYGHSEEAKNQYFKELVGYIKDKYYDRLVVAGPGFAKETLAAKLKENNIKFFLDSVSNTGEAGVEEVMRRGIVEKIIKNSEITQQTVLVEKFLAELARSGLVAYGQRAEKAVEMGAVSMLLISDKVVRQNEPLLKACEKQGGAVRIIDSHHEAGQRFYHFGLGAFLRYKVE